jgi:transcriptional regulator with XRE-family HTH domain
VFGASCRSGRLELDLSQQELADALGIHRGHLANIELGRVNISADLMDRIAVALGQRLELIVHGPRFIAARRPHDLVHAWCTGYVVRRLGDGWQTAREVAASAGGIHGWIDILAYQPATSTLAVIEIKSRLDDFGAVERQVGWYERRAPQLARELGWRHRQLVTWLIVLAADEVDRSIQANRDSVGQAFPGRADGVLACIRGLAPDAARSMALIDPASRRSRWLIRTRLDGRRSPAPYRDYADAARRIPERRH